MKIGFFGAGVGGMVSDQAGEIAVYAEELGYSSLWAPEHMVLPNVRPDYLKVSHEWGFGDPLISLAYLAAYTSKIELCTGVLNLPQRHPVQLAKELATLDILSYGRLVVGVGMGHLDAETRATGVDPALRAALATEYLDVMRALWKQTPSYHGKFVNFEDVAAYPTPLNPGGPRIVMGGASKPAYRRAAAYADGWYGWGQGPQEAREAIQQLGSAASAINRDLTNFEISVTPLTRLTPELVQEYEDAGVHQLVIVAESETLDGVRRRLDFTAPSRLGLDVAM